jgi:hypothetical protein
MATRLTALLCFLALVTVSARVDGRLASVRKAFVVPMDDLGDDQPVAACFADHLPKLTAMTVVSTREEAEVILKVSAHLPSATTRFVLGIAGGSPSAHLFAELPDGTKVWDDGAKYRRSMAPQGMFGSSSGDTGKSVECGLGDELAGTLRDAMRDARGSK